MSEEQLRRETLYQVTMHLLRKMMEQGLLSREEYADFDTIFAQKYQPIFGTLFSEMDLL